MSQAVLQWNKNMIQLKPEVYGLVCLRIYSLGRIRSADLLRYIIFRIGRANVFRQNLLVVIGHFVFY